jgi:hypothetical protein
MGFPWNIRELSRRNTNAEGINFWNTPGITELKGGTLACSMWKSRNYRGY